jgi:hypothetical protein
MSNLVFTPKQNISNIVKDVEAAFRTGKTLPVEWRKEQLRQVWRMLDVCAFNIFSSCMTVTNARQ